jgi:hypothetical protein
MRRIVLFAMLVSCLGFGISSHASAQVPEYELKAEFIGRFPLFVDWPDAGIPAEDPFVIGLLGDNPFGDFLEARVGEQNIEDRPVEVREIEDYDDISSCQMLFIAETSDRELKQILGLADGLPILTMSDSEGYGEKGVMVNFYVIRNQVRFEINEATVRRSGLHFSARLYKLARLIEPESR